MRFSQAPVALFLDFDGVICNSLEECYRSSWLALAAIPVGAALPPEPPSDSGYRSRFDACRPFVRSGEDYLVAHEWAAAGKVPADQAAFDGTLNTKGSQELAELKRRLYAVREDLLSRHRSLWLSWNPLYEGIATALKAQVENSGVWILSTKKAEFIAEILAFNGVKWPLNRTLYTGTRKKLDMVAELSPEQTSVLIDDQVDHLDFTDPLCRCYLASWGYVTAKTVSETPRTLSLPEAIELISLFPRGPRSAGSAETVPPK